jgi:DNA-binding transcriptional MerR regulator
MNAGFSDKFYYKIGEVAKMVGVRTSVLRFWESEFDFLKPEKSNTGQRLYTIQEVKLLQEVKRLLYTEKFTLEGVRKRISRHGKMRDEEISHQASDPGYIGLLKEIKAQLLALRCRL